MPALKELWREKFPKQVASVVKVGDLVIVGCEDGCVYALSGRDVVGKVCPASPVASAGVSDGKVYVALKNGIMVVYRVVEREGMVEFEKEGEVRVGKNNVAVVPLDGEVFACGEDCSLLETSSGKRVWGVDVGRVMGKVKKVGDLLYVPDSTWRKIHIIDIKNRQKVAEISYKERIFDLDVVDDKIVIGASKSVAVLTASGETLWSKETGGYMNLVCACPKCALAVNVSNKDLRLFDIETGEELEVFPLGAKSAGIFCFRPEVFVSLSDGILVALKVEGVEEEGAEEKVKEEGEVREEKGEERKVGIVKELEEIAEGSYAGTPLAKELLEEVKAAEESLGITGTLNDVAQMTLEEVKRVVEEGGGSWEETLEKYREALEKLESLKNLIENAMKITENAKECPDVNEILRHMKTKTVGEFIDFLKEIGPKDVEDIKERVAKGKDVAKLCVLKEILKVDPSVLEEVERLEKKLREDIEALEALLGK